MLKLGIFSPIKQVRSMQEEKALGSRGSYGVLRVDCMPSTMLPVSPASAHQILTLSLIRLLCHHQVKQGLTDVICSLPSPSHVSFPCTSLGSMNHH